MLVLQTLNNVMKEIRRIHRRIGISDLKLLPNLFFIPIDDESSAISSIHIQNMSGTTRRTNFHTLQNKTGFMPILYRLVSDH